MKTFTTDGIQWILHYDLPTVRRVRNATGVDLLTRDGVRKACESLIDFGTVLATTLQPQFAQHDMDEERFLVMLERHADAAVDVWLEALADFFRRAGKPALATLATAVVEMTRGEEQIQSDLLSATQANSLVRRTLDAEAAKRRQALDRLLTDLPPSAAPGSASPSSPPSQASIPSPSV